MIEFENQNRSSFQRYILPILKAFMAVYLLPFLFSLFMFYASTKPKDWFPENRGAYETSFFLYELLVTVGVVAIALFLVKFSLAMGTGKRYWYCLFFVPMLIPLHGDFTAHNPMWSPFFWYLFIVNAGNITKYQNTSFLPLDILLVYQQYVTTALCVVAFVVGLRLKRKPQ